MSKVSIIIPASGEKRENLTRTLKSIYDNATGDFEVILGLNGPPFEGIEPDKALELRNLRVIKFFVV